MITNTMKYAWDNFIMEREGIFQVAATKAEDFLEEEHWYHVGSFLVSPTDKLDFKFNVIKPEGTEILFGLEQKIVDGESNYLWLQSHNFPDANWYMYPLLNAGQLKTDTSNKDVMRYIMEAFRDNKQNTIEAWESLDSKNAKLPQKSFLFPCFYLKESESGVAPIVNSVSLSYVPEADVLKRTIGFINDFTRSESPITILSAKMEYETTGEAQVTERFRLKDDTGEIIYDGNAEGLAGKKASKVIFSSDISVTRIGEETARLRNVQIEYQLTDDGNQNRQQTLITTTEELGILARYIRLTLKHDKSDGSTVTPYVSFKPEPKERLRYQIGVGNGALTAYSLPDKTINPSSLRVFTDSLEFQSFDFNLLVGQVIVNAEVGEPIYASYKYDYGVETWIPLKTGKTVRYRNSALYSTDYSYMVPDNEEGKSISTIKFVGQRNEGTVESETIGTGNGSIQLLSVEHYPIPETIKSNTPYIKASRDSKFVEVYAADGEEINVSYDWYSGFPRIYGYYIAWNE